MKLILFESHGPEELSYWNNGDGYVAFKTLNPDIAAIFKRRKKAILLTWGVNKRYMRVFEEKMSMSEAAKLVKQCLKKFGKATN